VGRCTCVRRVVVIAGDAGKAHAGKGLECRRLITALQPGDCGLLHAETLGKVGLSEAVVGPVADDKECDCTGKRSAVPSRISQGRDVDAMNTSKRQKHRALGQTNYGQHRWKAHRPMRNRCMHIGIAR
jgi:hypothetical protein